MVFTLELNNRTKVNSLKQGCLLSPLLFLLAVDNDWIMKKATDGKRNGIQWTMFNQLDDLDFGNDVSFIHWCFLG
jgi:hypothetical protein